MDVKWRNRSSLLLCASVLVFGTIILYGRLFSADFVNFDDTGYVVNNEIVKQGLTAEGVRWAFTSGAMSNWHPLTWLSHMLDVEMFRLDAGRHHAINIVLHVANSALLLWLLFMMTGSVWRSALVAALFAWHPLHVESVAWIAERKDVLSTLFGLLSLIAYVGYVRRAGRGGAEGRRSWLLYALAWLLLALGLLAKPMLVTWPCVMLLLDFWPLGRLRRPEPDGSVDWKRLPRLVLEKVPFFALAIASGIITLIAQGRGGAVVSAEEFSSLDRFANAAVAYVRYLLMTVWPRDLSVFYPHDLDRPLWQPLVCGALLVLATLGAWRARRRHPYCLAGWLWYLGTLLPVIGLVQVGNQALADRYTYIPLIGIFMIVAWAIPSMWAAALRTRWTIIPAASAVLIALAIATWNQTAHWKDSFTLWEHALAADPRNFIAHNNYGLALDDAGRTAEAVDHWRIATELHGNYHDAHYNYGLGLFKRGEYLDCIPPLIVAARLNPSNFMARYLMGIALREQGYAEHAITALREAIALKRDFAEAHYQLGLALMEQGPESVPAAAAAFERALRLRPGNADALRMLEAARRQRQ